MSLQGTIEVKLQSRFDISQLNILNESHLHAGHKPEFDGQGETHFRIQMVANDFKGKTRVARHRLINDVLKDEFENGLHALALELSAPDEPKRW